MVAALRVLLLDADPAHAAACEVALCTARPGAALMTARDASEALALAVGERPDVLLIDVSAAGGMEALRRLRTALPERPLVALTAPGATPQLAGALRAGAQECALKDSRLAGELAQRVVAMHSRAVQERRNRRYLELDIRLRDEHALPNLLDAAAVGAALLLDADHCSLWVLAEDGVAAAHLSSPLVDSAQRAVALSQPAPEPGEARAALLDPMADGLTGSHALAVAAVAPTGERLALVAARERGAWEASDAAWAQRVALLVLGGVVSALDGERVRSGATVDAATGLPNRRELLRTLDAESDRAQRQGTRLAVLLVELGGLPEVTPGRLGDDPVAPVLREAAAVINGSVRRYDLVARLDPRRLAVVLPGAGLDRAETVARRVHGALSARAGRLTVTCGVAAYPETVETGEATLDAAEQALIVAAAGGGDGVVVAPSLR